jgi:hypothetical protein
MEVKIKVRFNASKERFETYGRNMYLLYLPFDEDPDSESIIAGYLSKNTGTPEKRIFFKTKDAMGNWIFELT